MITIPDQLKELEYIVIDFNECIETVAEGLEQLDTGAKVIVDKLRVEVEELSKEIDEIIKSVRNDKSI